MTLYRQLLIFISVLFLLLFCGAVFVKIQTTRTFLEIQLESHAQDTATSLGLSIAPHIGHDMATVEAMMNAIFDRGFYRNILLTDLDDAKLSEKRLDIIIDDVPDWFLKLVPLTPPSAKTLVSSGWQQTGYLYVTSHPGYAYQSLWQMTVDMGKLFLLAAVAIMVLGIPVLQFLFKPLNQVEKQAESLSRKQYVLQEKLPKTRELRSVVVAMNAMVGKVRRIFEDQAEIAANLQKRAYRDPLTGLGNRRYLELHVNAAMKENAAMVKGALLLAECNDLAELNREKGFEAGDLFLVKAGKMIKEKTDYAGRTIARVSGGVFAVLLPEAAKAETTRIAEAIGEGFADLGAHNLSHSDNAGSVGGICYRHPVPAKLLFTEAERMLRISRNSGKNTSAVEILSSTECIPRTEQQWNDLFNLLLEDESILLLAQKAAACDEESRVIHTELLSRIILPGGDILSANVFIPLAERLNRMSAIDRMVVKKAFAFTRKEVKAGELAVNLSSSSLRDEDFRREIFTMLKNRATHFPEIVFEFAEFNIGREFPLVLDFARQVKALGGAVGIDHFGRSSSNFGNLYMLQPKYVKIDRAFTEEINGRNEDGLYFLKALTQVARSIDILVIAEAVENPEQQQTFCSLGIDGIQGYHIEKPWDPKNA